MEESVGIWPGLKLRVEASCGASGQTCAIAVSNMGTPPRGHRFGRGCSCPQGRRGAEAVFDGCWTEVRVPLEVDEAGHPMSHAPALKA